MSAIVSRNKGNIFCPIHPTKELTFMCDDCEDTALCNTCISTTHKGHSCTELEIIAQPYFNVLQDFNTETEKETIPDTKNQIQVAIEYVTKIEQILESGIRNAETRQELMIEIVNNLTTKAVSEFRMIIAENRESLNQFKETADECIKHLESIQRDIKEATTSKHNILMIDVVNQMKSIDFQIPEIRQLQSKLSFIPGSDPEQHIKAAFGVTDNSQQFSDCSAIVTNTEQNSEVSGKKQSIHVETNTEQNYDVNKTKPQSVHVATNTDWNKTKMCHVSTNTGTKPQSVHVATNTEEISVLNVAPIKVPAWGSNVQSTKHQAGISNKKLKFFPEPKKNTCSRNQFVNPKNKEQMHPLSLKDFIPKVKHSPNTVKANRIESTDIKTSKEDTSEFTDTESQHLTKLKKNKMTLTENPVLKTVTELPFKPRSLVRMKDGTWCICKDGSTTIHFVNNLLEKFLYINVDVGISDIAIHPSTYQSYCLVVDNNTIQRVDWQLQRLNKIFEIEEFDPTCFNISNKIHPPRCTFLIGDNEGKSLSLYTEKGNKLEDIELGSSPRHISMCPQSGRIAIACSNFRLIVLSLELKKLYCYKGCEQLNVYDSVFDNTGHLLVTHSRTSNSAATGDHLQTISLKGKGYPFCVALQAHGELVVGTENDKYFSLLSIKYLAIPT